MKMIPVFISCAIFAAAASIPSELPLGARLVQNIGAPISVDDGKLALLEEALQNSGLSGFWKTASELMPAGCPTIYSRSHCDRLAASLKDEEKRQAERATRVRNLGKRLLKEFELVSAQLAQPGIGTTAARATAEQMLALSDWILKGNGYGNVIIGAYCRHLGAVAAAHVVIDESIPVAEANSLVESLRAFGEVEWFTRLVCAYEHESPGSVAPFVKKEDTPAGVRNSVLLAAMRGESILRANGVRHGEGRVGVDLEATRQARLRLEPGVAVYLADPLMGGSTLDTWDSYSLFPEPRHTRLMNDLYGTMFFRKSIGGFPLEPLPEGAIKDGKLNSFYTSRTQAAFSRAWEEFSYKKEFLNSDLKVDPNTGAVSVETNAERLSSKYFKMGMGNKAARVYESVKSGNFQSYLLGDSPKR